MKQFISTGIASILVITSTIHMRDVVNLLGSDKEINCDFTCNEQVTIGGVAHALALAEDFTNCDKIAIILADSIFGDSMKPCTNNFLKQKCGVRVLLKEVGDPERHGVAAIDEYHVMEIEKKQDNFKSNFAVVGLYFYDNKVFDNIRNLILSEKEKLEITSANNIYIESKELRYDVVKGKWIDASPFKYIKYAIVIILNKDIVEVVYNAGDGNEYSNIEVVHLILDVLDKTHDLIEFVEDRSGHDWRYSVKTDKVKELVW